MILGTPLPDVLMCSIAEGGIRAELAVAKLVVAGLADIEGDGSASSDDPLALTVAEWVHLTVAASAPVVRFAAVKVDVGWEDTSVRRHARWSVATLLVRSGLGEINNILFGEVRHILHRRDLPLHDGRFENFGFVEHDIAIIGYKLAANGTMNKKSVRVNKLSMISSQL